MKHIPPTEPISKYGNCPKCGAEFMAENEKKDFGCGMCGYTEPIHVNKTLQVEGSSSKEKLTSEPTVEKWESVKTIKELREWALMVLSIPEDSREISDEEFVDAIINFSVQEAKAEERVRILEAIQPAVNDFMAGANILVEHKMVKSAKEIRENTQYIVCAIRGTEKEYAKSLSKSTLNTNASLKQEEEK